jgi:acetyltransferase
LRIERKKKKNKEQKRKMDLKHVLDAESVAIVGASKMETKRGFQAIKTLLDGHYGGGIYPVNPKESSILGVKCYKKVSDIKDPVDIALITTPAGTIPGILEDCGKKGVHGAVIIAGGFGETGAAGKDLEREKSYPFDRPQHLGYDQPEERPESRGPA